MVAARIAVIDDDDAVRISTCAFLDSTGFAATPFESGDAFLAAQPNDFDAVLLDVRMPGTDGVEILKRLKGGRFNGPVLMLSGHGDIALAVQAMRLGALDFLEKPYEADDLLERIEHALDSASHISSASFDEGAAELVQSLTPRQRDVLKGIASGMPTKIIAHRLGLSPRTVDAYRAQLLERLRVRNMAEAVKVALRGGLDWN
jgi:two-component system response regulator FixJ